MLTWLLMASIFGAREPVAVTGTVWRWDGIPASLAQVVLVAEPPFGVGELLWQETQCDEGGRFRLSLPYPTDRMAFVIARHTDGGLGWQRVTLTRSTSCRIVLHRTVPLTGQVSGMPNAHLFVRQLKPLGVFDGDRVPLHLARFTPPFLQAHTDATGRFAFAALPDGFIAEVELATLPVRFTALVGDTAQWCLPPMGIVAGTVQTADGAPLPNALVHCVPVDPLPPDSGFRPVATAVTTDVQGNFRVAAPAGKWLIWLPARGDAEWVSAPQIVSVPANTTVAVTLKAQRAGIVRGWVADAQTRFPLPRLFVHAQLLYPIPRPTPRIPVLSEVARQLPEGAYELRLPNGIWLLKVADDGWQSEPVTVEVAEGAVLEAPFIFARPFPTVHVTVVDQRGQPTQALIADGDGDTIATDANGTAHRQIPPGRPVRLIAVSADKRAWATEVVTGTATALQLPLRTGVAINGTVVGAAARPLPNTLVSLWAKWQTDDRPLCLLSQRSDAHGRFAFFAPADAFVQVRAYTGNAHGQTAWQAAPSLAQTGVVVRVAAE